MRKDDLTQELPGVAKRPGRPPSGRALTGAERQRLHRQKKAAEGKGTLPPCFVGEDVLEALAAYVERQNANTVTDKPMTVGDAVEKFLRDRLLRKR